MEILSRGLQIYAAMIKATTATKLSQLSKFLLILSGKTFKVIKANQVIPLWGNAGLGCCK